MKQNRAKRKNEHKIQLVSKEERKVTFIPAADAVNMEIIPKKMLKNGTIIPGIGLGTFGSDHNTPQEIAQAVYNGLCMGYRFIDCAACYGNEAQIGEIFAKTIAGGLSREELFVVSKVWNDSHDAEAVLSSCKRTLRDLQLDYLDVYLVHWPFPNYHAPGCDADARNPDSKPYIHENFMRTWRAMENLIKIGLVRNIGTSNVTIPKLKLILKDAEIKPVVNEMELHPCFQQEELFRFCLENEIQPIGYSPLGSPGRPERDRTQDDVSALESPIIQEIAKKHQIHPVMVCLKWAVQRGQIPIPFSTKRANLLSNLQAVSQDLLSAKELKRIDDVDCNCRLIKGQVFLWEGAKSWEDLWDINGEITGLDS